MGKLDFFFMNSLPLIDLRKLVIFSYLLHKVLFEDKIQSWLMIVVVCIAHYKYPLMYLIPGSRFCYPLSRRRIKRSL